MDIREEGHIILREQPQRQICAHCGYSMPADAGFCGGCGSAVLPPLSVELGDRLEAAETATRHGAIAALVVAVLTVAYTTVAIWTDASGGLAYFNDPTLYVDALFAAALGFGIKRHARGAAIGMLCYYIFGKWYIWLEVGVAPGIWSLVFLFFFGKAVWGAFTWHKLRSIHCADYRRPSKWIYVVASPVLCVVLMLCAFGAASVLHVVPSTTVDAGEDMSAREIDALVDEGLLLPGESVVLFYSEALFSVRDAGNFLTDERVVSYERVNGDIQAHSAGYADIVDVRMDGRGSLLEDSTISVETRHGDLIILLAPTEEDGDVKVLEELRRRVEHATNPVL